MQSSESIRPDEHRQQEDNPRSTLGTVRVVTYIEDAVHVSCEGGWVTIRFYADDLVRIHITPDDSPNHVPDLRSTDAILEQPVVTPVLSESEVDVRMVTPSLEVVVQKQPFSLAASRRGVHDPFYTLSEVFVSAPGALTLVQPVPADSHFYGLGEKTGYLDKRGESYAMWNSDIYDPHVPEIEALYVSIPFLLHKRDCRAGDSVEVVGVLLDNPGRSRFDMRSRTDAYIIVTQTGAADLYLIPSASLQDAVRRYTALTGRMAMPPKWALGYHQSRYSYMSSEEVLELARTFRAKQIPCDAIYLDIHYMNGYRVFTFDADRFPEPSKLTDELHELGFRLVPIVDPWCEGG